MKCRLCYKTATEFLDLGRQPLANKYPRPGEPEDFFPMQVFFCPDCKNVQLGEMVSRERMFEDYYYLSSVNQGLVRHFDALAEDLKNAKLVVDIGSNDGILLRPLKKLGVPAVGIEPSVNVSKLANDEGLMTIVSFFDAPTVEKIVAKHGKADVIVCSSVFTHLEDPHQVIEDVKNLMSEDGSFIIEVEYLGDIIKNVQFERFYFDRPFYYSITSLVKLFERHGMHVADVEHIEPHGGSLRVTVKHGTGQSFVEETLTLQALEEFRDTSARYVADFKKKLEEYKAEGVSVAGYSCPARVSTITNFGDIGTDLIPFIVDDSTLKQGRTSPGKHIPIVPKEYLGAFHPDLLVVFAYEYIEDIKKKTGNAYRYLIPIPPREV
jgi:SAM-dependent methyltransferase